MESSHEPNCNRHHRDSRTAHKYHTVTAGLYTEASQLTLWDWKSEGTGSDGSTTQLHHSRILSPEYFPYTQMESVSANNCRNVFASSTPTSKVTFNRCPERLRIGIRFITIKIEALGSYYEDRYLGYLGYLG